MPRAGIRCGSRGPGFGCDVPVTLHLDVVVTSRGGAKYGGDTGADFGSSESIRVNVFLPTRPSHWLGLEENSRF